LSCFEVLAQEARSRWQTSNLIRKDKFDIVLPQAMRNNSVDMWIHVIQQWKPDPLGLDLGVTNGYFSGYFVFSDRTGERVERAVLGRSDRLLQMCGAYDLFAPASDLNDFVAQRDPKRIAVNMSDKIGVADGLSHHSYLKLRKILGEKYANRLVSAEKLIADFRSKRVSSEIGAFTELADFARRTIERALSNNVITPGVTTREDVAWWVQDQLLARGMGSAFGFSMPSLIHSFASSESEYRRSDYIIQRGDVLQFDFGATMNNFGTDAKRHAYVLREGETNAPAELRRVFDEALAIRELIREHIGPGRTGAETLEFLYKKVEAAGFVRQEIEDNVTDTRITEVNIGCHSVGNLGHCVGPSIWIDHPWRLQFTLEPSQLFSFELFTYPTVAEWGGKKLRIGIEDDALLTEVGVEWLYPVNDGIILIK
jgi:Xaa-Pro aminopeptidase